MTDQPIPEAWRTDPRERLLAEQRSLALDYLDSLTGQKITETDRQRLLQILDDGRQEGPLCGKTQATDGNTYPPCARPEGHIEAYCRDATRNAYFIAADHPAPPVQCPAPEEQHMIQPGQTYRSLDPRGGPRIRIVASTPGSNRVTVVDANTGKRPRSVFATALHASPITKTGQPRRTGYALEQP